MRGWWVVGVVTGLGLGGCAGASTSVPVALAARAPVVTMPSGPVALVNPPGVPPVSGTLETALALQYVDVRTGTGEALVPRQCVYAHYTGWLEDGTKFDSSRDSTRAGEPREPIVFAQGARRVIPGWDYGFAGMRVGGVRRLIIPFVLGYGESGRPPVIPERATLVFDVELLAVRDTLVRPGEDAVMPGAPPSCAPWGEVAP
jgi:peptidylprolyl isomerase